MLSRVDSARLLGLGIVLTLVAGVRAGGGLVVVHDGYFDEGGV